MPYEIPECAGTPYEPSNGTEFMLFNEMYCDCCTRSEGCEHAMRSMAGDQPSAWTHDERGRPICTDWSGLRDEKPDRPAEPERDTDGADWVGK